MTAPVSPMAPALSGVSATQASPGFSTTSSASLRADASVAIVIPLPNGRLRQRGGRPALLTIRPVSSKCLMSENIRHFYSPPDGLSMEDVAIGQRDLPYSSESVRGSRTPQAALSDGHRAHAGAPVPG